MENDELLKKISSDIDHMKAKLDTVQSDVDGLKTIEVKSSGGLSMKLKRNEFFQRMFDKPEAETITKMIKEAIKNSPINTFRNIARDSLLFIGVIAGLLKIFEIV